MQTFHFCGRVALGAFELFKNRNELSSLNFCSEKSCCASFPSCSEYENAAHASQDFVIEANF